jgi:hypothetical protein
VRQTETIPVTDPFGVAGDPEMPSLAAALDPIEARRRLGHRLGHLTGERGAVRLMEIRVTRYKPGRRCVVEYDVEIQEPNATGSSARSGTRASGPTARTASR